MDTDITTLKEDTESFCHRKIFNRKGKWGVRGLGNDCFRQRSPHQGSRKSYGCNRKDDNNFLMTPEFLPLNVSGQCVGT